MKVLLLLLPFTLLAQVATITGTVTDAATGKPLPYVNIRTIDGGAGTAANSEGDYRLTLPAGKKHTIIASFIGYLADTLTVDTSADSVKLNIALRLSTVQLPEVTVFPGENPALAIIERAIERKEERNAALQAYAFEAFTKGIMKTPEDLDVSGRSNSVTISAGLSDSSELAIGGVIENTSKGFYRKPDDYKEIITGRKQTANIPSFVNTVTGGRMLIDFYQDVIPMMDNDLTAPLHPDAVDFYFFYLRDTVSIDNKNVFKIYMTPDDPSDPGFEGDIYIADKTFDLLRIELSINDAANIGGILDTVTVFQQFQPFGEERIYMPVDYHLTIEAGYLGLIRIGFELHTLLTNYTINQPIPEGTFSKAIVTVVPDADEKPAEFWNTAQTIPQTLEERQAYHRLDSLQNVPLSFWDRFSFLSESIPAGHSLSITGPMGIYQFNRISGHTLSYGISGGDYFDERFWFGAEGTYGFADERFYPSLRAEALFGDYRTTGINVRAGRYLKPLFHQGYRYSSLFMTLSSLLAKEEYFDYYYSEGFNIGVDAEVAPVLAVKAGFENLTQNSAQVNTDFSVFNLEKSFRPNPMIFDTRLNLVSAGIRLDFRDYIEDGIYRRRVSHSGLPVVLSLDVTSSAADLLSSELDFTTWEAGLYTTFGTFPSADLTIRANAFFNNGSRPYQLLYALPGNADLIAGDYTFRTLEINEIVGDRALTVFTEHDFGASFFRATGIPYIKDMQLTFSAFANMALVEISDESRNISPWPVQTFRHPFYEAGFTLGHVLVPIELSFGWKLNHTGTNNFRFGLSSFITM